MNTTATAPTAPAELARADRNAYDKGFTSGSNAVDPCRAITAADKRRAPQAWYVGFFDAQNGEPKFTGLTADVVAALNGTLAS